VVAVRFEVVLCVINFKMEMITKFWLENFAKRDPLATAGHVRDENIRF
jgi:hypothetical protein